MNNISITNDLQRSLNFSDKQREILHGALNLNSGQSEYQSRVFVAHSQLTPYRMLKQCLLELETRHHTWFNVNIKIKKKKVEIQMAQKNLLIAPDDLVKQMVALEIEDMENDIRIWERKLTQAEEEIHVYLDLVEKISEGNEELLSKAYGYDEEEERNYWISRMAKQAALDMVAYGRLGSGNMDSIAMMPEEDQIMTLATSLQYKERLFGAMTEIGEAVNRGLLENGKNLPKYNVPAITDKLLTEEIIGDVQYTPKP